MGFLVHIPGVSVTAIPTLALTEEDAIREALFGLGLRETPPGTSVTYFASAHDASPEPSQRAA